MESILLLKLLLVPTLIGAITLAGRRWGPALAGWLSGFPVFAGPVLLIIAIEQGAYFTGIAAWGALGSVPGNTLFCLAYAWCAMRCPWWLCLPAALLAYIGTEYFIISMALPTPVLYLLTLAALWISARLFPNIGIAVRVAPPLWPELFIRMVAGAALVMIITFSAEKLGPQLSGLLSAVPLLATILAVFSQATLGPSAAIYLLRGMVGGFYALATFCFVLTFAVTRSSIGLAFIVALISAIAAQFFSLKLRPARYHDSRSPRGDISVSEKCVPKLP